MPGSQLTCRRRKAFGVAFHDGERASFVGWMLREVKIANPFRSASSYRDPVRRSATLTAPL